jgi:hypothetical protein
LIPWYLLVLQECYKSVTRALQECYECVTRVCYKSVLQACVTRVLPSTRRASMSLNF